MIHFTKKNDKLNILELTKDSSFKKKFYRWGKKFLTMDKSTGILPEG
jgi:hypothetical protein